MKELVDGNTQAIAQLFDRGYSGTVVSAANDVVYGRLRNTTNATEFINGDITFLAQLNDSLPDSFA